MAAFKARVRIGFYKGAELDDPSGVLGDAKSGSITSVKFSSIKNVPP